MFTVLAVLISYFFYNLCKCFNLFSYVFTGKMKNYAQTETSF